MRLYDVTNKHIKMIACKGKEPAYPIFPINNGLNGRAVSKKEVIVSNDIQNDPDYLTTFGQTQSEIIIPIISTNTNKVVACN
jgi:putative methionine-R-sulfoxide reductase with GAF domain